MTGQNVGASVRARLLNSAKAERQDFFDLGVLARHADFDGDTLTRAIRATFERRATPLPDGVPFGLSEDFAEDRQKQTQWKAFLAKNALAPVPLSDVLDLLRGLLMQPFGAVGPGASQVGHWRPGGGWC